MNKKEETLIFKMSLEEFERNERRVNKEFGEILAYSAAWITGIMLIILVIIFAIRGF